MNIDFYDVPNPENAEIIIGQGNFSLKMIEDLYFALLNSSVGIKFGVAMNDGSGKLTRYDGNDKSLINNAKNTCKDIAAGHVFVVYFKNAFPVHVLKNIRDLPTFVNLYVASSNPIKLILAKTENVSAILGVADGYNSEGFEDQNERKEMLKKFGLKI